MGIAYGIDLGTTYSAIARLGVTGAPEVIPDVDLGKDTLASAVYFSEDGTFNVGDAAKEEGVTNPERLHQFFKRWIGRDADPDREHYMTDGKEYDPIELSTIVLGRIIDYAKASGEDVKDVVITCPAYFDYAQRDATRQAGVAAGLNVLAIINEPTAAAINHCFNRFNEDQTVLVYDLGGGTFDVTLMEMTQKGDNRIVDILGTDGNAFLGGCDWDEELYKLFINKYLENYGGSEDEMDEELKIAIRGEVEQMKFKLSTKPKVKSKIAHGGESIALEVTREEFESATAKYVQQTVNWMNSVIEKAGLTDDDIDIVLMVGGSTKMPMIKDMLIARFGEKAVFGDPDKSVAKGAAIVADMKLKEENVALMEELQKQIIKGQVRIVRGKDGKAHIESTNPENNPSDVIIPGDEFGGKLERLETEIGKALEEQGFEASSAGVVDMNTAVAVTTPAEVPVGDIIVNDVAPRTFGLIVARRVNGNIEYIVDNIVQKGEKTPCAYNRTYYTPEDNCERLSFPVIESLSNNEDDPVGRNKETGEFIFADSSLEMKQRQQLILEIPAGLPMDSEIEVEFKLDDLGNVYLEACEPRSGAKRHISFSFNELDKEELGEMRKRQEGRIYAVND